MKICYPCNEFRGWNLCLDQLITIVVVDIDVSGKILLVREGVLNSLIHWGVDELSGLLVDVLEYKGGRYLQVWLTT